MSDDSYDHYDYDLCRQCDVIAFSLSHNHNHRSATVNTAMDFTPHAWLLAIEEDAEDTDVGAVSASAKKPDTATDGSHDAADEPQPGHDDNPLLRATGDRWVDALLSDTDVDNRDMAGAEASALDEVQPKKRGRGRPVGTGGSYRMRAILREEAAAAAAAAAAASEEDMLRDGPPGSIEYARAAKRRMFELRQNQVVAASEATVANPHEGRSSGTELGIEMESSMGSDVMQTLAAVWASSRQQATKEPDRAVNVVLGRVATTASGAAVARLLQDVKGSVQDMLLQAGAAIYSVGCWFWCVLLTYMQLSAGRAVQGDQALFPYRFVLLLVKLKYDETPCRIRISVGPDGSHQLLSRKDPAEAATHAKIMQVSHTQMALLQHTLNKNFVVCCYNIPTRLSAVDRTTAENIRAVLQDEVTAVPDPLQRE